jgi:hypothetical protein
MRLAVMTAAMVATAVAATIPAVPTTTISVPAAIIITRIAIGIITGISVIRRIGGIAVRAVIIITRAVAGDRCADSKTRQASDNRRTGAAATIMIAAAVIALCLGRRSGGQCRSAEREPENGFAKKGVHGPNSSIASAYNAFNANTFPTSLR